MKHTLNFKTILRIVGTIALVAVIGFSMTACGGDDDPGNGDPTSATYTSYDASGNSYTLVVTKDPNRAAYNPQPGDTYVLTIKNAAGTETVTSTGTVSAVNNSTLTLKKGESTFTITVSGEAITTIPDTIPLDGGSTKPSPGTLTPNKPSGSGNGGGNGNGTKYVIDTISIYNANGELTGKQVYEYDSNGTVTARGYNANGDLTGAKQVAEYDANGNLIEQRNYTANDVLDRKLVSEYDSNGNRTKQSTYDASGALVGEAITTEWDSHGNITKATVKVYSNGTVSLESEATYENKYDTNGNLIEQSILSTPFIKTVLEYDANGNVTKQSMYNSQGGLMTYQTFVYKTL